MNKVVKKILAGIIILFFLLAVTVIFTSCKKETSADEREWIEGGNFIIVKSTISLTKEETILEDKNTGVLYIYLESYNKAGLSPLLNPDGTPMLSEKAWEDRHGN